MTTSVLMLNRYLHTAEQSEVANKGSVGAARAFVEGELSVHD